MVRVRFLENDSSGVGGGMTILGGSVLLRDSVFSRNRARRGGALAVQAGKLALHGCSFAGNQAPKGQAVYLSAEGAIEPGGLPQSGLEGSHQVAVSEMLKKNDEGGEP